MNPLKKAYCRIFQKAFHFCQHFVAIPIPRTIQEENGVLQILDILTDENLSCPLFVCGKHAFASTQVQNLLSKMNEKKISYQVYTDIHSDPQLEEINKLYQYYNTMQCDSIIAIGGGSVLDASKALGIKVVYPKKSLQKFRGFLKVHKKIPYFIAVPTTSGTGSEATVCSVVTDGQDKFAINDPHLVPKVCVLDSALLSTLTPTIVANTGMDAFTHAIEAYLGKSNTKMTKTYALNSMKKIHSYLEAFYQNPSENKEAREQMLVASYEAGVAFTRAYVGYVHALAHAVGGLYHVPHGYAIAILLPYVLEAYDNTIIKDMAKLYDALQLGDEKTDTEKKNAMIQWIRDTNSRLGIPSSFKGLIEENKYRELAIHANKEANPFYPVPKELDTHELESILVKANESRSLENYD